MFTTAILKPDWRGAPHAMNMLQVFTNAYSVGFGDINRGIDIKSEFLDTKWRALLTEIDLSYRHRNGTSELPFEIDQDISMCDWRNSFSDGLATYSFPVNWPIKPQHAMQFFAQNNYTKMYENSGHVASASWQNMNYMFMPNNNNLGKNRLHWMPDKHNKLWLRTADDVRLRLVCQPTLHARHDTSTILHGLAAIATLLDISLGFRLVLEVNFCAFHQKITACLKAHVNTCNQPVPAKSYLCRSQRLRYNCEYQYSHCFGLARWSCIQHIHAELPRPLQ
jgi:hypothetical protein